MAPRYAAADHPRMIRCADCNTLFPGSPLDEIVAHLIVIHGINPIEAEDRACDLRQMALTA